MADPLDDADEKPLDPAVEQVQRRLRRLMLISGLTLGFGIFFVFLAILYRLFTYESSPAAVSVAPGPAIPTLKAADLGISPEARLVSSSLDGNRVLLTYSDAAGVTLVIVDLSRNAVIGRLALPGQ